MMYSAYKLNKQGDNIQPWRTPFPIWNQCYSMSRSNCCFLTWIQISQEAIQVGWYSHLLNFPQFVVIHTVKGFSIVNKTEIDVFLELSCFFGDTTDVGSLLSGSCAFSNPAWTFWNSQFTYCWSLALRILIITLLLCEMSAIMLQFEHSGHCLPLGLEWKLMFSSPLATAEFSKLAGIWSAAHSQHHLSGFEIAQLELHHLH